MGAEKSAPATTAGESATELRSRGILGTARLIPFAAPGAGGPNADATCG